MKNELNNLELNTQEKIREKFITAPYKKTVQQAIKNCKLMQNNLKFEDEINFTTEQLKVMQKKHLLKPRNEIIVPTQSVLH